MNEDTGHDPTVPTTPVAPNETNIPVTPVEATASNEPASNEPVGRTEATEPVAVADPEGGVGQAPPNLPPRPLAGEPLRRRSVAVPMWALAALGALIILGIGLLGGYAIGSDDHGDREGHRSSQGDTRESNDPGSGTDGAARGGANAVPPRQIVPPTRVPRGGRNGGQVPNRPQPANPSGAFLGVSVRDSSNPPGATVIQVGQSGPAKAGGLKARDVITAIDATSIKNAAELTAAIRSQQPGAKIALTYERAGVSATANVTLGDRAQLRAQ